MKVKNGFTLVEMLVVIAILGILMAMMIPAASMVIKRAKISSARTDAGLVMTALAKYQAEYNRFPAFIRNNDQRHYTDPDWVAMMNPSPGAEANPNNLKRIMFFQPSEGTLGKEGANLGAFVDPWGNPFEYIVDLDRNGEIPHPYENLQIRAQVIAWSAGPDGDYDTWGDNVAGWE